MRNEIKLIFLILSALIIFINGCSFQQTQTNKLTDCKDPIKNHNEAVSVKGKKITYTELGNGKDKVLFLASIHGSERAGTPLLNYFKTYLINNCHLLAGKTVIIIPVVNPDGYENKTRYNSNYVDLNRNFPSNNRMNNKLGGSFALSEPESYFLYKIIHTIKPSKIITFHESLGCIDYNGPAVELAERLSAKCNLPVRELGAKPGSLGSYAGEDLNIPIITVEMTKQDSKKTARQLWQDYKELLFEAIN